MHERDFRRIALAMDGVEEASHMGHPDFRVGNRIFVTLQHDRAFGGLMLTPDQQQRFLKDYPGAFKPAAGAWGRAGATIVSLAAVPEEVLGEAMTFAWQNAIAKGPTKPSRKKPAAARKKPAAVRKKPAAVRKRSTSTTRKTKKK